MPQHAPYAVGNRIRVLRPNRRGNYEVGKVYVVETIDDDNTLRARCPRTGKLGGWIPFDDIELANVVGWRFLQGALSPEAVRLLRAFDGVEHLTLRESIKDKLLLRVDNLAELLCEEAERLDSENPSQNYRSLGPEYDNTNRSNNPADVATMPPFSLPPGNDGNQGAATPQPALAEQLQALFHGNERNNNQGNDEDPDDA